MEILAQVQRHGDGFSACFPWVIVAIAITVGILLLTGARASFGRTLHQVAVHLHGRVLPGRIFHGYDRVQFEHGGELAELRFSQHGNNRRFTHLEIQWSGPSLRCEVYPETFLSSLQKLMGMEDIVIGSPQFDWRFVITGDDAAAVKALLNSHVQLAILELANFIPGIHVRFSPRSLTVTCSSTITNFARLIEFVRLGQELHGAALATVASGIEFLDGSGATGGISMTSGATAAPRCMVCGESLDADVIYCRSCRTPHHRDCWSYSGGCSTYGCREKTFVRS